MHPKLRSRGQWRFDKAFTCRRWWHRRRHSFTIEERGPAAMGCAHEIWTCSCGKRWQIDLQHIDGIIYVRAAELKGEPG